MPPTNPTNPAPLPPERLAEIAARAEAASVGPWNTSREDMDSMVETEDDGLVMVCYVYRQYDKKIKGAWARIGVPSKQGSQVFRTDARFIAHARQDIPDLLAEVARLAAENLSLNAEVQRLGMSLNEGYTGIALDPEDISGELYYCSECHAVTDRAKDVAQRDETGRVELALWQCPLCKGDASPLKDEIRDVFLWNADEVSRIQAELDAARKGADDASR